MTYIRNKMDLSLLFPRQILFVVLIMLFMALPVISMAGTVSLPQTGQTTCYDEFAKIVNCTGTGQDGDIQAGVVWPDPRFTDNGDSTVTDNLTGLVWAQDASATMTWQDALDYVAGMNTGRYENFGHTDWRLPNINELESLVNAEEIYQTQATWLNSQGFANVQYSYYWSSTTYSDYSIACYINMYDGHIATISKAYNYYVWPVRSGNGGSFGNADIWKTGQTTSYATGDDGDIQAGVAWPDPRFTDNGDGSITDNLTGLMWTQDADLDGRKTWQDALDYVTGMNAGTYENFGHTDWRLPNRKELFSLIDRSQTQPVLPAVHPFTNVQTYYWSSTSTIYGAWAVGMEYGYVSDYTKAVQYLYVWPVRSGTGKGTCTYSISPTSNTFDSSSGTGNVSVTADSDCEWTAKSNANWINITSGSEGTGDGTVTYSVDENTNPTERTGTMTIAGKTFTVTQDGTCEVPVSISPLSQTFNYSAVTDSVDVSDPASCGWTVVTNAPDWITIKSGSSGSGDGTVTYSVLENTKTTSRTGTITIAEETFTVTQEGTGLIDNAVPSVEIDGPVNGSTTDLVYFISGTSSDAGPSSGINRVVILVSDGSGNYLVPDDPDDNLDYNWSTTEQWITTAREDEVWFYDTSNVPWNNNVGYEVTAKVYDNAGYSGEAVISFTFQINYEQLKSTLSLELSSNAILQEETIDVSGKLTPLPDDGTGISNNIIKITITAPDGAVTSQTATTGSDGGYQKAGISGFTQKGTYTIQASFEGTSGMAASSSDEVSLQVGFAGYTIIVEGKVSSEEGLDSHNKTTNNIYNALLERGFIKDNIYYFNYDTSQTGVDAYPDKADIQYAISTWPMGMMNSSPGPLYIILHDHGNTNTFYVYNDDDDNTNDTITPSELDSWLDTLESGLESNALLEKRIIIYGACYSGSFISALSKAATDTDGGRVVITSAAEDEESYKGTMEEDGIRSGSYFLEEFFGELERGYSIKESFESATDKTEMYTREGGDSANTNNAYLDSSMQHPLLDDGGDRVGSNDLSENADDGQIAKDLYLGTGETYDTNFATNPAEILYVTETLYISPFETNYLLWAAVNDKVESAWIEIRPPSQTLSETGGTEQLSTDYEKIPLSLNDASGNWEIENATILSSGLYEVFYFVSDKTTGEASAPMRSLVYKDEVGNNPPHISSLDSPAPVSEEKTSLIFRWNAASDPDGEDITYTYNLLIATDEEFNNVVYKKEEITTTAAIVDARAGLSDLTIYYWKVQAVDAYGLTMDSAQTWPFYTNNTNFGNGFITGKVYDDTNYVPIKGATIIADIGIAVSLDGGDYIMSVAEGTYTVTSSYNGYFDASFSGIRVDFGETTELNMPMTSVTSTDTDPTPDIKANGSDGPVTISQGDLLTVKASLDPESHGGENADWWVYATSPFGTYWYTLSSGWVPSDTPIRVYGGPLFNLSPYTILEMSTLPIGNYVFNFEVDNNMDNVKDGTYTDSVEVNIQ